jgi:hypothetical protein
VESRLRSYATAGIALVGASVIAITPVTPSANGQITEAAVRLAASADPVTTWLDVFDKAETNFAALADTWLEAPAPILQQVVANQLGYLSELPDFESIITQIADNLRAAVAVPFANGTGTGSLDAAHEAILGLLPLLVDIPPELRPLIDVSTNYLSGALLGLVGPVIGPTLALGASTQAILANLTSATPDPAAALNDLVNIPATMAGAFLNGGQTLDLTPVLSALGLGLELSPGTPITVGLTFGGLLSPGGSIFNALDLGVDLGLPTGPITLASGQGPGTIGSLIGLSQAIAKAIGWRGTGNPLAPKPATSALTVDAAPHIAPTEVTAKAVAAAPSTDTAAKDVASQAESPTAGTAAPAEEPAADESSAAEDTTPAAGPTADKPDRTAAKHRAPGGGLSAAVKRAGDQLNSAVSDLGKVFKRDTGDAKKPSAATPSDAKPAEGKTAEGKISEKKGGAAAD